MLTFIIIDNNSIIISARLGQEIVDGEIDITDLSPAPPKDIVGLFYDAVNNQLLDIRVFLIRLDSKNRVRQTILTSAQSTNYLPDDYIDITDLDVDRNAVMGLEFDPVKHQFVAQEPQNQDDLILFVEEHLPTIIQQKLDQKAQQYQYSSIISAVSYISSVNQRFAREAQVFNRWRDEVWNWYIQVVHDIKAGKMPHTSSDQLVKELPTFPFD